MSFQPLAVGSGFGLAACLVESACITPAGQYAATPNGVYLAGGPFWAKTRTEERSALNRVILTGQGIHSLLGTIQQLAALITQSDTGVLMTAAAVACCHGLPANFGPGRGNWCAADVDRIRAGFFGGAGISTCFICDVVLAAIAVAAGNLTLTFHNRGGAPLATGSSIVVEYILPGYGRA